MTAEAWKTVLTPVDENPSADGYNRGGLVIGITNGQETREVSRVAFVRRNSRNPSKTFKQILREEIDKANDAALAINEAEAAHQAAEIAAREAHSAVVSTGEHQ